MIYVFGVCYCLFNVNINRYLLNSVDEKIFSIIRKENKWQKKYVDMNYKEEDEIASKYIEFHYIELPKYKKKEPVKFTKLDQWMCIFTQNEEGIVMAEKEKKK